MEATPNVIITIHRQLGSGGAYLGQQLARKLGISYADREIIRKVAESLSLAEADLESNDEKIVSFWKSLVPLFALGVPDAYIPPKEILPMNEGLFKLESKVIQGIAKERSAVIIGRCGYHLLRDFPNHLSIFLHADLASRRDRVQKLFKIEKEAAEKMVARSDRERASYNHMFTGNDWSDARQYDFSFDSGRIGLDRIVELVLSYLKKRQATPDKK